MKKSKTQIELLADEAIFWEGGPTLDFEQPKFSWWLLISYMVNPLEKLFLLIILIGMTFLLYKGFITFVNFILFPILLLLNAAGQYGIDYLDSLKLSKIKYVVTNQRIFFQSWKLFKGIEINTINFKDIQKLSLEEFDNGIGNIYCMGTDIGTFKNSEHYPALLLIKGGKELKPQLEKIIKERKRK